MSAYEPTAMTAPAARDSPLYHATFGQAFVRFWTKYATFSGRASLSEYWWFALANAIVYLLLSVLFVLGVVLTASSSENNGAPGVGFVLGVIPLILWFFATLVGSISLTVRRLHDANLSGLFYLITFVPSIGSLALLVLTILPSNPEGRRFDLGGAPLRV